ncbi:helix-turn-helix transcriptional regulator [Azospirillum sp. ST 5-10]|uniref:helix-turn-helix transcriptional regulator n=1 Tax=unclassified Azospirillum TaxID=2630922 RepID=UPI003F49D5FA
MSSQTSGNCGRRARTPVDRLLARLKTGGPQGTAELAAALGVTGEAARQRLARLADDGLVEARAQVKGVGRPLQVWSLTAAGHARFPDGHAELTAQLLRALGQELGADALDRLIAAREREIRAAYGRELEGAATLADRVARLTAIRSREGYMAEWRETADGSLVLVENHCPIGAAATVCEGFCRSELAVFRALLGPFATVERLEHIARGARRCAYRIAPAS